MRLRLNLSKIPEELKEKSESGDDIIYLQISRLKKLGKYNATHGIKIISDKKFSGNIWCGNGWENKKYDV
jgi:hypothetical protein